MNRFASRLWLVLFVLAVAAVGPTLAQENGADADREALQEKEPELVLRIYDIRDYLITVPTFGKTVPRMNIEDTLSCSGGSDLDGCSLFDDASVTETDYSADLHFERLRFLIERSVQPAEQWEDMGGRSAMDFDPLTGRLLVRATEKAHREIADLLSTLRPSFVTLMADVQVVELSPEFVADAYRSGRLTFATDNEKTALAKAVRKTLARGSLQMIDGQRVWDSTGMNHCYVSDVEPVVAACVTGSTPVTKHENGDTSTQPTSSMTALSSVAYDPTISYMVEGLLVDLKATVLTGDKDALVAYRLMFAYRLDMGNIEKVQSEPSTSPICRPTLPTVAIDHAMGAARVPFGASVLLMSNCTDLGGGKAAEPSGRHFILTIHRLGN